MVLTYVQEHCESSWKWNCLIIILMTEDIVTPKETSYTNTAILLKMTEIKLLAMIHSHFPHLAYIRWMADIYSSYLKSYIHKYAFEQNQVLWSCEEEEASESHSSIIKCNQLTYFLFVKCVWKHQVRAEELLQDSVMLAGTRAGPLDRLSTNPRPLKKKDWPLAFNFPSERQKNRKLHRGQILYIENNWS